MDRVRVVQNGVAPDPVAAPGNGAPAHEIDVTADDGGELVFHAHMIEQAPVAAILEGDEDVDYTGWPNASRKEWRLRLGPVYVAITRAKHRLVVLYQQVDPVIQRIKETGTIGERQAQRCCGPDTLEV